MSFLAFFHSLLSQGVIPKDDFHIIVWYGDGYGTGKFIQIRDEAFHDPIFEYLEDTGLVEKSSVKLSSMHHEYRMEYLDGAWHLVREWHRPE